MSDFDWSDIEEMTISLELEDGSTLECEVIYIFEWNGDDYAALTPVDETIEEIYFFGIEADTKGGQPEITLLQIEDEEMLDAISDAFDEMLDEEEFGEDEDEDEDDDEDEENEPTEDRTAALKSYDKDTRAQFKKGEIERDDLVEFLCDFYDKDKKSYKKMSDKEILDAYIEASSNLIDDDGEIVEEGAYTVNGVPYCCGRPLSYDEDEGKYVCEHCGGEYEADEE